MAPSDEITTGELGRRLDAFGTTISDGFKDLGKKIDDRPDWQDVRRIEAALIERVLVERGARDAERLVADKAISGLEEWNRYAVRIVLSALGTGVVGWAVVEILAKL